MRLGRTIVLAEAVKRPQARISSLIALWLAGGILVGAEAPKEGKPAEGHGAGAEAVEHRASAEHPPAAATAIDRVKTNAPARAAWEYFADPEGEPSKEKSPKVDYVARLEIARHHTLARQYSEAATAFSTILEENAPEPIQKIALLELAQMAFDQNDLSRAEQILSQWLARWADDPKAPEIFLRQGLIYRRMGLHTAAITKFYSVMTSALVLKPESFGFYQKLVLRAQNEIAETQFQLGNWADAANSFGRLLRWRIRRPTDRRSSTVT